MVESTIGHRFGVNAAITTAFVLKTVAVKKMMAESIKIYLLRNVCWCVQLLNLPFIDEIQQVIDIIWLSIAIDF